MKCIDPAAPEEALLKILRRDKVSSLLQGPPCRSCHGHSFLPQYWRVIKAEQHAYRMLAARSPLGKLNSLRQYLDPQPEHG
nr:hypothetical protein Iba_chr09aCG11160 [Ipomoea batatas]